MASRSEPSGSWRGLSVRQLTLIFLGAVGVCAIFFALGYLVGANRQPANAGPMTEQVPPPSEIPPTVNPPAKTNPASESEGTPGSQSSVIEQNINPSAPASAVATPSHSDGDQATQPAPQSVRHVIRAPSAPQGPAQGLMVQVAASHAEADAASLARALRAEGYHSVLVTPRQAGLRDHIYRVQVGPYGSRPQALEAMRKLSEKGYYPFIKR
ncbi:MAG: SPOR domain-containing protein [Terriglobia bacterium]